MRKGWFDVHRGNSDFNISMSRDGLLVGWVAFIFMISIVAYLSYYQAKNQAGRNTSNLIYGLILFFSIVFPLVFFLYESPELGSIVGLLLLGFTFWWIATIMTTCCQTMIVWPLALFLVWLGYNILVALDIYYAIENCPEPERIVGGPGGFFPT